MTGFCRGDREEREREEEARERLAGGGNQSSSVSPAGGKWRRGKQSMEGAALLHSSRGRGK